jgi:hypothetical protein
MDILDIKVNMNEMENFLHDTINPLHHQHHLVPKVRQSGQKQ